MEWYMYLVKKIFLYFRNIQDPGMINNHLHPYDPYYSQFYKSYIYFAFIEAQKQKIDINDLIDRGRDDFFSYAVTAGAPPIIGLKANVVKNKIFDKVVFTKQNINSHNNVLRELICKKDQGIYGLIREDYFMNSFSEIYTGYARYFAQNNNMHIEDFVKRNNPDLFFTAAREGGSPLIKGLGWSAQYFKESLFNRIVCTKHLYSRDNKLNDLRDHGLGVTIPDLAIKFLKYAAITAEKEGKTILDILNEGPNAFDIAAVSAGARVLFPDRDNRIRDAVFKEALTITFPRSSQL